MFAERKLLPALYHRQVDGQIVDSTCIYGVSRAEMSDDEYRAIAREALKQFVKQPLDEAVAEMAQAAAFEDPRFPELDYYKTGAEDQDLFCLTLVGGVWLVISSARRLSTHRKTKKKHR